MSYCTHCGKKDNGQGCYSCKGHVHGSGVPYSQHTQAPSHHQESRPIVVHNTLSPAVTSKEVVEKRLAELRTNSRGRPIISGFYEARDNGVPCPFAKVTVTFSGTDSLVALFMDANKTQPIDNPATTDQNGRLPIYYAGGPIDVITEKTDEKGKPCKTIDRLTNYGGYVDSDFFLGEEEVTECIELQNPLLRLYDADNCNLPNALINPTAFVQWGNFELGLPVGTFSAAQRFFECRGEDFQCGTIVFGDTTGRRFQYDCENCTTTNPPDPETVTFDNDNTSECWISIDGFSACQQPTVPYSQIEYFAGCNTSGANVKAAIPPIECNETYVSIPARGPNGQDVKLIADLQETIMTGNSNTVFNEADFRAQEDTPMALDSIEVISPCAGVRAQISLSVHVRGSFSNPFQGAIQYNAGISLNDPSLMQRRRSPAGPLATCSLQPYCDEKIITYSATSPPLNEGVNTFYLFFQPGEVTQWDAGEIIVNQHVLNVSLPIIRCC